MTEFITGISDFVKGVAPFFVWLGKFVASAPELTLGLIAFAKSGLASAVFWAVKSLFLGKVITSAMTTGGQIAAGEIAAAMAGKGVVGGIPGGGAPGGTPPPAGGQSGGVLSQLSQIKPTQILATAVALVAIGAAIWLVADGMSHLTLAFKELNGPQALGAVAGIAVIMGGFVAMLYAMAGATGVLAMVASAGSGPLIAFGFSMLMIGGAIAIAALGFSVLVDSFTKMFAVIGPNGDSIMKAGAGFFMMAAGLGVLAFALVALSASALLAVVGLGVILGLTTAIVSATTSLSNVGGAEGIVKVVNAINSLDTEKLDAIQSLSNWMALLGGTTTIKFDESLEIDGEIVIKGESGGRKNTDWINDPDFISNLKDKIIGKSYADRNGGKIGAYNKFA
jgi:hypothetical protein